MSGVISKAIHILDSLVPQGMDKELSVTEISIELDMPVQSTHRILSSLCAHGFVSQNSKTKKYKLGLSIMKYGFLMRDSLSYRSIARPYMLELSQKTRESVYLSARENDEGVFIDAIDSPQILKISEPIGLRLPLYVGASNRIILAFLPEKVQEDLLQKVNWNDVPSLNPLTYEWIKNDLIQIRSQGHAITSGEATEGTVGIAAPIFSYENIVIGGISIAGPDFRFKSDTIDKYCFYAKKYAEIISKEMGYRKNQ
jgi:IclR family KDG regulon transcriptional repressor